MPDLRRNNRPGPCSRKIKYKPRSDDAEQAPPLRFFMRSAAPSRAREKDKHGKTARRYPSPAQARKGGNGEQEERPKDPDRAPKERRRKPERMQARTNGPTPDPLPIRCQDKHSEAGKAPKNHGKQPKRGEQGEKGKKERKGGTIGGIDR